MLQKYRLTSRRGGVREGSWEEVGLPWGSVIVYPRYRTDRMVGVNNPCVDWHVFSTCACHMPGTAGQALKASAHPIPPL